LKEDTGELKLMDKILIILGAGATRGSGYKLKLPDGRRNKIPVDKDFLKVAFENKIHKKCQSNRSLRLLYRSFISLMEEFRIIKKEKVISNIGLEEVWNTVVLNNKFVQQNLIYLEVEKLRKCWKEQSEPPQVKKWKRADYFLRVLIQKVYGEMIITTTEDNFRKLFALLKLEKPKPVSFITFNYDLCLENSLSKSIHNKDCFYYPNFNYRYNFNRFKRYPIYKLHGSLNWWHGYDGFIRPNEDILKSIKVTKNRYFKEKSFNSWEKYQPSIIPMDFLKEEFFNEQGQHRLHRHYMNLWKQAGIALGEADTIVIIGYSFPPADPHVRWLMRASQCNLFSKENKFRFKSIFFVTKCNKDEKETIDTLKTLFTFKYEPTVCMKGFENCFEDLKKWLNEIKKTN